VNKSLGMSSESSRNSICPKLQTVQIREPLCGAYRADSPKTAKLVRLESSLGKFDGLSFDHRNKREKRADKKNAESNLQLEIIRWCSFHLHHSPLVFQLFGLLCLSMAFKVSCCFEWHVMGNSIPFLL
jgi:hypothetical protein